MELGHGRMTCEEVGEIFDLSLSINSVGLTHDKKLLNHYLFRKAQRDWINHVHKVAIEHGNIELPLASCPDCNKQYYKADLKIIDGMAECPGQCGRVFIIGNIEPPIVARLAKEGDRERRA